MILMGGVLGKMLSKNSYKTKCEKFNNVVVTQEYEWSYIEPVFGEMDNMLTNMYNNGLIQEYDTFDICDAGIGLGTTLYGFYLESKKISNTNFNFFGVEKYKEYVDFFNTNLKTYWEDNITIYNEEIKTHNYQNYNMVYTYAPFKKEEDLISLYQKIVNDLNSGGILIETAFFGKGFYDSILDIHEKNKNTTELLCINNHSILRKL